MPPKHKAPSKYATLWQAINWVAFDDFEFITMADSEHQEVLRAKQELYEALRDDEIRATGLVIRKFDPEEREKIEPSFWHPGRIKWSDNEAHGVARSYVKIQVERNAIAKIWFKGTSQKSRAGRPPVFDETEFLRLCVWEAAKSGLPPIHDKFRVRLEELLSVLWKASPGDTWLKEAIGKIYLLQTAFENGRKRLDGK